MMQKFRNSLLKKTDLFSRLAVLITIVFLFCLQSAAFSQQRITEVYPGHWWPGMKWHKVQVMVHGENIGRYAVSAGTAYAGVSVKSVKSADSDNYLFVDVDIAPTARPGTANFIIRYSNASSRTFSFRIKKRRTGKGKTFAQGVGPQDVMYLIMPDRFSNGDTSNDKIAGMKDQSLDRDSMFHRHGGDIKGIINHLDYLQDLGVSSLWLMPVLENDMPDRSEHGYAFTNHYKIDPRLGGEKAYLELGDALHARNMKLVQDAVYNHVGLQHITVLDKPFRNWLHEWPTFTQTNYKDQTIFDPYAAPSDKKIMTDGWFVKAMPDLNQQNPFVANYLIQHALYCVEEFGVDGFRIDTYAYNDLNFMNRCNKALYDEYPAISIFGETWVHGVPNQSYFCQNNYAIPFKSNLQNTTDFQMLFYGIQPAVNEKFGWTEGVNKLYTTTAQDFVYAKPYSQVIFLDNHDLSRFYSVVNEDVDKYKMALGWLFTFRGIPQMYYGMEQLMTGFANPDGLVREDFKGGWKGDSTNKFTAGGRTAKENDVFNYIRTLLHFRNGSAALQRGKLMQFLPKDGLYAYTRTAGKEAVICIMNTGEKEQNVTVFKDFKDASSAFSKLRDVITGNAIADGIQVPAGKMRILEMLP